jgi:hypothetical protein
MKGNRGRANKYEFRGDTAVLFLSRRGGRPELECLIDAADLPAVAGYKWNAFWAKTSSTFYVHGYRLGDPCHRKVMIHRLIMKPPPGQEVDHIHFDGLDNRRSELRNVTHSGNCLNNRAKNPSTGIRHIILRENGTYQVELRVTGTRRTQKIGCFRDIEIAKRVAVTAAKRSDAVPFPSLRGLYARVSRQFGHAERCFAHNNRKRPDVRAAIQEETRRVKERQEQWLST